VPSSGNHCFKNEDVSISENHENNILESMNEPKVSLEKDLEINKLENNNMLKRIEVTSSNIDSIGYNSEEQILEVCFHNRNIYRYFNVPQHIYDNLMSAASHGKYFNANIRNSYTYKQI
jgi:hypothetical protein